MEFVFTPISQDEITHEITGVHLPLGILVSTVANLLFITIVESFKSNPQSRNKFIVKIGIILIDESLYRHRSEIVNITQ